MSELVPAALRPQPAHALAGLPSPTTRGFTMWRYGACIPVPAVTASRFSLGEGGTPLVRSGGGVLRDVWLKLEQVSPTGSFKDRGAAVLVASAAAQGARELIADSSGNAGSAIAAYAARAELPCRVFVPTATSPGKRAQIIAYGAELELVDGDRAAAAASAQAAVRERDAFYASHVYDSYFLHGTKTLAFELWEQLGEAPAALVVPAGNGTLLLGAALGFAELKGAGLIERTPALIAVQAERCAPLAQAWKAGADAPTAVVAEPTQAEGIAIATPARGSEMLQAVADSGGLILSVPEAAIDPARAELARRGLLVEPTAAVSWAAVLLALSPERLGAPPELTQTPEWERTRELLGASTVAPLTGSGLKSPRPA